jgi:hypothetical protein
MRIGLFNRGEFICDRCALKLDLAQNPMPCIMYLENILPYSQQCFECYELIVDGAKRLNGTPINLYEVPLSKNKAIELMQKIFELLRNRSEPGFHNRIRNIQGILIDYMERI